MTCNIYLIFHNFLMKYKLIFWNWIYFKYRRTYMWFKKCITSSIHTRYLNVSITKNTPDYSIVLANFWLPYLVICNFEQSMLQSWPLNGGTIHLLIQSHVTRKRQLHIPTNCKFWLYSKTYYKLTQTFIFIFKKNSKPVHYKKENKPK